MKRNEHKMGKPGANRMGILMLLDIISILLSYGFALLLRFDFVYSHILADSAQHVPDYIRSMPVWCGVTVLVFFLMRLYHSIWRQASVAELRGILFAYLALLPCYAGVVFLMKLHLPMSYYIMGLLLNFCMSTGIRFSFRILRYVRMTLHSRDQQRADRVMVIGAGAAGQMLIKELQNSDKLVSKVCCVIDDNPNKLGKQIEGVDIVGNRHDIVNMAQKYKITRIVYAIPSNKPEDSSAILNICKETNCRLQIIPGMYQLLNEEISTSRLRDVEVTDLLGREQVKVNKKKDLWLCILLGWAGGHRFYQKQYLLGFLYLALCWCGFSMAMSIVDLLIIFPKQPDEDGNILM